MYQKDLIEKQKYHLFIIAKSFQTIKYSVINEKYITITIPCSKNQFPCLFKLFIISVNSSIMRLELTESQMGHLRMQGLSSQFSYCIRVLDDGIPFVLYYKK